MAPALQTASFDNAFETLRIEGHRKAAEIHAVRRLCERYSIESKTDAYELMFEHLALVLAGESRNLKHGAGGNELHLIERDGGYWVVFSPVLNRLVTYLTPRKDLHRILKHRDAKRMKREIDEDR